MVLSRGRGRGPGVALCPICAPSPGGRSDPPIAEELGPRWPCGRVRGGRAWAGPGPLCAPHPWQPRAAGRLCAGGAEGGGVPTWSRAESHPFPTSWEEELSTAGGPQPLHTTPEGPQTLRKQQPPGHAQGQLCGAESLGRGESRLWGREECASPTMGRLRGPEPPTQQQGDQRAPPQNSSPPATPLRRSRRAYGLSGAEARAERRPPAGFRYITYRVHNCSQKTPASPFSGPVDRNSLFVENDYIFFTVRCCGLMDVARGDLARGPFHGQRLTREAKQGVAAGLSSVT